MKANPKTLMEESCRSVCGRISKQSPSMMEHGWLQEERPQENDILLDRVFMWTFMLRNILKNFRKWWKTLIMLRENVTNLKKQLLTTCRTKMYIKKEIR